MEVLFMSTNLRWRFGIMMFFEFLVWAAWFINVGPYMQHMGFSGNLVSAFFLASFISPFIGGQIVDRYIPTQIYMAVSHILGGILLIFLANIDSFMLAWLILFVYSMIYAPTLGLSNSICFHHLKDREKEFGAIRVWGSIGWVVAGLAMSFWWKYVHTYPMQWDEIAKLAEPLQAAQREAYLSVESWLFIMPGIASIIFGFYCFLLPHTPPSKESVNPWAFIEAFKLMKDKNFSIFMIISLVVSTQLMFFFISIPV
ncbi:MAG: MFS transporter, partial [Candidatus Hinthialibacter sp.]